MRYEKSLLASIPNARYDIVFRYNMIDRYFGLHAIRWQKFFRDFPAHSSLDPYSVRAFLGAGLGCAIGSSFLTNLIILSHFGHFLLANRLTLS